MTDAEHPALQAAAQAQRNYADVEIALADLRALRVRAFRAARTAGFTFRQIAAVTGLSFQRIRDIVDPRPQRPTPRRVDIRDIEI